MATPISVIRSRGPIVRRGAPAVAALLLIALAAAFCAIRYYRLETAYDEALRLQAAGENGRAYDILTGLGGYADSADRIRSMVEADPALPYWNSSAGDLIEFGSYEQDGDVDDGPEPIRWIVLDRIDDRLLLISLDCIGSRQYHHRPFEAVTWEESDLRKWMNSDFLAEAFTDAERTLIPEHEVANAPQSTTGTDAGPMTIDRIFALSETEATIYIASPVQRGVIGASLLSDAASNEALSTDEDGYVDWWLRSPGTYAFTAQFVDGKGARHVAGANVDATYGARPALWLDTSSAGGKR